MDDVPRSKFFDDVYFSAQDGLAETQHVFLDGNNLPNAWDARQTFTIAELGFGTGLNFLSALSLFDKTAKPNAVLDFVSIEKYPLSGEEIKHALSRWQNKLNPYLDHMLDSLPIRAAGFHRVLIPLNQGRLGVLTLIYEDVLEGLKALNPGAHGIECWFLDGFTPAKNPEMWSQDIFHHMARLSAKDASFSSFTAAGDVRRGLSKAGFHVEKQPGFGRKRDMITGQLKPHQIAKKSPTDKPRIEERVAIIGGGLAGTACAYILRQYGFTPVIYEGSGTLAHGASGNDLGLYNPRLSALRDRESGFYAPAFAQAVRTARTLSKQYDIDFSPTGNLHFLNDDQRIKRFTKCAAHWHWHHDHMQLLTADEASDIAGVRVLYDALYLPDGGALCPRKLCHAYADGCDIHLNTEIKTLEELEENHIILACSQGVKGFAPFQNLYTQNIRGQLTTVKTNEKSTNLRANLCYRGYITTKMHKKHIIGASFDRKNDDDRVLQSDHDKNLSNLYDSMPDFKNLEIIDGRTSFRMSSKHHFPIIGRVDVPKSLYVSTAFGSYGIVGSIMGAHLIADQLRGGVKCLPKDTINALSPKRFITA